MLVASVGIDLKFFFPLSQPNVCVYIACSTSRYNTSAHCVGSCTTYWDSLYMCTKKKNYGHSIINTYVC